MTGKTSGIEWAVDYLYSNPDHFHYSGRKLERTVNGRRISYRTWNEAKRLARGTFADEPKYVAIVDFRKQEVVINPGSKAERVAKSKDRQNLIHSVYLFVVSGLNHETVGKVIRFWK